MTFGTGQMLNTTSYYYNADGIRTQKRVGTASGGHIIHDYLLDGSTILKETITNGTSVSTLYYYYDESGISGIEYNGTKYSYVKNLQGDIVAIVNAMGSTVVEYKYDAWGKLLSTTGSMASTLGAANPFRYRGYYYDTESGFYYLQSRYYDPQVGRFLNADGIIGANGGIMGYNMFAYCSNNPVMYVDESGMVADRFKPVRFEDNGVVTARVVATLIQNGDGASLGDIQYTLTFTARSLDVFRDVFWNNDSVTITEEEVFNEVFINLSSGEEIKFTTCFTGYSIEFKNFYKNQPDIYVYKNRFGLESVYDNKVHYFNKFTLTVDVQYNPYYPLPEGTNEPVVDEPPPLTVDYGFTLYDELMEKYRARCRFDDWFA